MNADELGEVLAEINLCHEMSALLLEAGEIQWSYRLYKAAADRTFVLREQFHGGTR